MLTWSPGRQQGLSLPWERPFELPPFRAFTAELRQNPLQGGGTTPGTFTYGSQSRSPCPRFWLHWMDRRDSVCRCPDQGMANAWPHCAVT